MMNVIRSVLCLTICRRKGHEYYDIFGLFRICLICRHLQMADTDTAWRDVDVEDAREVLAASGKTALIMKKEGKKPSAKWALKRIEKLHRRLSELKKKG